MTEDVRSYNVGASDYSKHKYQSWDFWLTFRLNPFDADLCKRTLRTKQTDGRLLDYKKIKHICGERIRQLNEKADVWPPHNFEVPQELFIDMIADYNLCEDDELLLRNLLYNPTRIDAYAAMQSICDKRIIDLSNEA